MTKQCGTIIAKTFSAREDWWHNACLNFSHDARYLYADGYKRAAELVCEHACTDRGELDVLVYPVVFLYRHYIELTLKMLLEDASELTDAPQKPKPSHKLPGLWAQVESLLAQAFPEPENAPPPCLKEVIQAFAELDPGATAFRYPTTREGDQSLDGISYINLAQFQEQLRPAIEFLEGAGAGVSHYLDEKRSYERDWCDGA
jgi:hypothetical protein